MRTTPTRSSAPGAIRGPRLRRCGRCSKRSRRRLTFVAGSRDDMGGELYAPVRRARRRREALRWLGEPVSERPYAEEGSRCSANAAAELEYVLGALAARGFRSVAAVDLTRAEIGVPVVRVLVAGLEGSSDAPDYVPGHRARSLGAR